MLRYGTLSVTGYPSVQEGRSSRPPPTIWYVVDTANCARIVARYQTEHEAREDVFRSNAAERAWEKQREQLLRFIEEHP